MGFTRAQLESFRDAHVPDLVGPGLRLVFVGINPGLWTAATQTHFAHPGNRFYPALRQAGIVDRDRRSRRWDDRRGTALLPGRSGDRDHQSGQPGQRSGAERNSVVRNSSPGCGAVPADFVAAHRPRVVAVAGITAYRSPAFRQPKAQGPRTPAAVARGGRSGLGGAQPERAQRPRNHGVPGAGVRRSGPRGRCDRAVDNSVSESIVASPPLFRTPPHPPRIDRGFATRDSNRLVRDGIEDECAYSALPSR